MSQHRVLRPEFLVAVASWATFAIFLISAVLFGAGLLLSVVFLFRLAQGPEPPRTVTGWLERGNECRERAVDLKARLRYFEGPMVEDVSRALEQAIDSYERVRRMAPGSSQARAAETNLGSLCLDSFLLCAKRGRALAYRGKLVVKLRSEWRDGPESHDLVQKVVVAIHDLSTGEVSVSTLDLVDRDFSLNDILGLAAGGPAPAPHSATGEPRSPDAAPGSVPADPALPVPQEDPATQAPA